MGSRGVVRMATRARSVRRGTARSETPRGSTILAVAIGTAMTAVGFFFSSRRRHTRCSRDWSSDVCSSDLEIYDTKFGLGPGARGVIGSLDEPAAILGLLFGGGYTNRILRRRPGRVVTFLGLITASVAVSLDRKSVV